MYIYTLVEFYQLGLKIFSGNEILTSVKAHNSITTYVRKMMCNKLNLDHVNINAHTKFGTNL